MLKAVLLMGAAWVPASGWAQQTLPTADGASAPASTVGPGTPPQPAVADPVLTPRTATDPTATAATQADAGQASTPDDPAQSPSPAQSPTSAPAADPDEPDIIVTGSRNLPGSVIGDIPPEVQLGPADIRSYGVSSIADLLTELAPQTGSGRGSGGQPVVLLNGRRISGFQEIRDYPTEAIARVDILPEEVALKYGYRADQRVVNFVLRRRFRAVTLEAADQVATEGGRNLAQGEVDLLNIARETRANLHLSYTGRDALFESDRDIIAPSSIFSIPGNVTSGGTVAGVPAGAGAGRVALADFLATAQTATDQTPYRTLLSSQSALGANATVARTILGNVGASINGRLDVTSSAAAQGLPTLTLQVPQGNPFSPFAGSAAVSRVLDDGFNPLRQRNASITSRLGTTFNGSIGTRWNWSLTGAWDRVKSDTITDIGVDAAALQARIDANDPTANPFGPLTPAEIGAGAANRARSLSSNLQVDALAFGRLFRLPAGDVSTSIRAGAETSELNSRSFRRGLITTGRVSRDTVNGQANIDLPIASARNGFLPFLGQLSLNANLAADELSDFGTLWTRGYGVNWAPVTGVRLIASATDQDQAPSAAQLGNPVVTTPNVRVFDYVTGTTATVTTTSGGNPLLGASDRHAAKVGLTLKPWSAREFVVTADYTSQDVDNPVQSFPTPTAIIEAAFPGRFTRVGGQLVALDSRPINFARSEQSQLRWGFNLSVPLKSAFQRRIEAFRAGTGPNPFEGQRAPGGRQPGQQGERQPSPASGNPAGGGAQNGTPPAAGEGQPAAGRGSFGGGQGGRGFGGPGGGFGGRGGGFGGGPGNQGGRLRFALYHTWRFVQRVTIADGGPVLDLLNGDATGQSGGQPRHELEGQAGYFNNGLGVNLSAEYRSATTVNGGTAAVPTTLDFGSLTTANLRLFADANGRPDFVRRHPWARGARVTFSVDNLFNQRQQVTDQTGTTPIGFQPAYLDALGRTVRLSVRKLFF